jgi:gamma-glutamyltranspeptidase/glutathione hydrolase
VGGFGFHLHNRGALFSFDPQHPNVVAPRKRPFNTIIPAFMEKGDLHIGFGIMGGSNQAQAHAQFVSNVADHGMNLQAAHEAPRFTKLMPGGCGLMIENRVPQAVREALAARGHKRDARRARGRQLRRVVAPQRRRGSSGTRPILGRSEAVRPPRAPRRSVRPAIILVSVF